MLKALQQKPPLEDGMGAWLPPQLFGMTLPLQLGPAPSVGFHLSISAICARLCRL